MTDSSDMDDFASITSGEGNTDAPVVEVQQEQRTQPRDERGQFATAAEEPVAEHQEGHEQHAENGKVPLGAVQAEREKRQAAQAEAEALRREIAELRGMVQATRQPAPQPQQEQQPASLWDDPDVYLKHQMDPLQQQLQETRNMLMQMQATQQFGADKVQAALEAAKAVAGTPQEAALEAQIMGGGNPFSNLVQWHRQQQVMSRIGSDPDAWLNAEIEKRMADPTFQAQVLERARGGVVQNGNRSQAPVTSIPPSLSRIPAGGNSAVQEQESDSGLFASTTSGRR